ncbi:MAG: Cna B-type domain-containing protein [Lachnospiraceae bacterium]|nr:Cna B-type domain-containing protein [Lachnospiraceae bacterium]
MKKRMNFRRALSGILSVVSVLSAVASPLTAYAAETAEPAAYEAVYPELDEVKDQLAADEIVTAIDIMVEYGSDFDAENDFEGIEYDSGKVKVTLHEAKSDSGQTYSSGHADTYKAVYYVEPYSGNPSYQVSRNIRVEEPATDGAVAVSDDGQSGEDDSGGDEDADPDPAAEASETESEETTALEMTVEASTEEAAESEQASDDVETDTETAAVEEETDAGLVTVDEDIQISVTEAATETTSEDGVDAETAVTETELESETETETESETETAADNGIALTSLEDTDSGLNVNMSYVSGLAVKSLVDGTAPFDDDDEAGNDSGSGNRIVRTFDYLNYTLEYTTALMDASATVDEAYMMVEFVLDCDPSVAEFNEDTLNWCVDKVITYIYSDGTASESWDSSQTVVQQVLTGKRYLSLNGDSNAIPGTGTLSVGVYVKAAKNGDTIQPSFTVWMEGNEESLYQSIVADQVTVSAAPRYNVKLTKNSNCNYLGYFDTESGTVSSSDTEGSAYGRLEGYAITIQLYNTSSDKGLKGIELPSGDFSFDLTVSEILNGEDVTDTDDYTPILWNYRENESVSASVTGYLGRQMIAGGKNSTAYGSWAAPWSTGGTEYGCYNGGSWSITQDTEEDNVYHVTVSGYSFDLEDLDFPTNNCGNATGTIVYGANVGCFSAGYVQFVVQFARSVDTTSNLYFYVEAENMSAVSISGQETTTDQNSSDNKSSMNVTLYPKGSISKRNFFYTSGGGQIASVWSAGDSYAYQGQRLRINSTLDYNGDGYLTSVNILQKFDDMAFEIPAGTTTYVSMSKSNSQTVIGSVTVLFAAKPDGTGWTDEAEMNSTREEELIYFETIDELNAAGYICVGALYEVRDSQIYQGASDAVALNFQIYVDVKDSAEIGTVYQTTNDVRAWQDDPAVMSWTEVSYGSGAYGLGQSGWESGTYADGYAEPTYRLYTDYGKSVYQNGNIVSGHSGGYVYGNSCLIIGCKTGVTIQVADETATASGTTAKSVYDLDAGERTVTYVIHPSVSVVSANSEVESSGDTTDVTVTAELPDGLTYVMNSASLTPVSVEENEDGTSTVTWFLEGQSIGASMEDITLSCIIGDAGTADDVKNNDTLTIAATITSDKDGRTIKSSHGNYSETTISVIKLATSSVAKAVEQSLLEEGDAVTYILRYGNSAEEDVSGVMLYDILPYVGDGRGSDFSGSYVVESITVDFSKAEDTLEAVAESLSISYTVNEAARNIDGVESVFNGTDSLNWKQLGSASVNGTVMTWSDLSLEDVTGLLFDVGTVNSQEYLTITVTLAVKDSSGNLLADGNGLIQEPGDIYANSFYQYAERQVAVVESNNVSAQVVERTVSGVAWLDADSDGVRDDSETLLSGITAALYRTSVSGYASDKKAVLTVNGVKLYTAYDVLGNEVDAVLTGKDGSYAFSDLEAGTYYVVFTGLDGYGLTAQDAGEDGAVDSDAAATVSEDGSSLENAFISGIVLPELSEMYAYLYESNNNDIGLLTFTSGLTIRKVEADTDVTLSDAVFVMKDADDKYLIFEDGSYTGVRSKVNTSCYLTTGEDGTVAVSGLPLGTYELSEYKAPDGYQKTDETWTVEVKSRSTDGSWTSYVTVDGETLEGSLTVENETDTTIVTVTKAWKDNDDQDGLRSDVTLNLVGTITNDAGEKVTIVTRSATIRSGSESWTYRFAALPVYSSGKVVSYSVTEDAVDGYTVSYSAMDGDWESGYSIVITNTHTPETTEYAVVKVWDDDENRDGVRPESIEVKLIGSDGSERVAKIADDDNWQYTFTDLPVYWNEGQAITYSVVESPVSGYVRSVADANEEHEFVITNTHEIETVDIPVEKIWDDNDDQDGVRAEDITVVLTGSDGTVREMVLTAESDWKYTFTDLPVYWNEGALITYSLQEKEVDGYTDEVIAGEDGYSFTVTNNHIPAVTDVVVSKVWDDADNQDGIRPESIAVILSGSDGSTYEAELTAVNGYSYLFSGLPVYYDHGTLITYTVKEIVVEGYETTYTVDESGYLFTITNMHEPEMVSIPVTKVWNDNDDQDGIRLESITVTLNGSNGTAYTAELTSENDWTYLFEDVYVYWNEGEAVEYTLTEVIVDGYETEIALNEDGSGFILTNTHEPETTAVTVEKVWEDDENRDGVRPENIHVVLTGTDGNTYEADLTADNNWTYVFSDLPVYYNHGTLITYTVGEDAVEDYETAMEASDDGYSFTLTNTHEIAVTNIYVEKAWDDAENQDGVRPDSIGVVLTGSDGMQYTAVLTEENGWAYTFANLPVYWNEGVLITYSLLETPVDGYIDEVVVGEDGYSFIVTNNHIPAVTDVVIVKEWDDAGNQDGIRPESITVTLTGTDGSTYEAVLTEDNGWVCVFYDLPVYWNEGEEIAYTVEEEAVDGYEAVVEKSESGYVFTISNSHTPETKDITVIKVWEDEDDKDGLRADVKLTLTGSDGSVYYGTILKDAADQSYTFTGLPVYANGTEIIYTLSEDAISGYTATITEGDDSFVVVNSHTPEEEEETPTVVPGETPKTGDESNVTLWIALAGLSLLGIVLCLAVFFQNRRRKE